MAKPTMSCMALLKLLGMDSYQLGQGRVRNYYFLMRVWIYVYGAPFYSFSPGYKLLFSPLQYTSFVLYT